MTMTTLTPDRLLHDATPDPGAAPQPAWLTERRRHARERFDALGLPGPRLESWRQTNLRAIRETDFQPAPDARDALDRSVLERWRIPDLEGPTLVFVNGRYAPDLSDPEELPAGVTAEPLTALLERDEAWLRTHLAAHADAAGEAFTALNTASLQEGVGVHVTAGSRLPRPLHVLSITTGQGAAVVTHPRNLVVVEDGAAATVIEDYVSLDEGEVHLTNAVTEIVVGAGADVHHYLLERESRKAFNVSTLKVIQAAESRFASHSVLLGGALVRNNVQPVLDGENGHSLLNGLYVASGRQHMDNQMRVVHAKARCDSRQYYKGILDDHATGVFSGRIVVVQDAQKTDAVQSNANLLLSADARAHAQPQLEIYADDVKCTHGATIGELDEQAMFYLRSRGLPEERARGLLVHAFALESLERMELAPIRVEVERLLMERLPFMQ